MKGGRDKAGRRGIGIPVLVAGSNGHRSLTDVCTFKVHTVSDPMAHRSPS